MKNFADGSDKSDEQISKFTCENCGVEKSKAVKLRVAPPRGWVKMPNGYWCEECKGKLLVAKPASVKVVGIVEFQNADGNMDATGWKAFKDRLKPALLLSTGLANASAEWLRMNDVIRTPTGYCHAGVNVATEKMPPCPASMDLASLRSFIRTSVPGLDSSTWDAVSRSVMSSYNRSRLDTVWLHKKSLLRFDYPYPLPFPSTAVKLSKNAEGNFVMRVRLLTGEAYHLILAKNHYYHNANLERVLTEEASIRETKLMYRRCKGQGHTMVERDPATRNKKGTEAWLKIVILRPIPLSKAKGNEVELYVHTDESSLLVAQKSESIIWRINADHLKQKIQGHHYRLHRLMDDRKAQRGSAQAKRVTSRINDVCRLHNAYVDNALKQLCGELAEYASSRKVTVVKYDDSVRDFSEKFPWRKMQDYLANALRSRGIEIDLLSTVEEESLAD
jgi:hypothetical protein